MPTGRDYYVDQVLTNALVGWNNPALIAGQIGVSVPVSQQTGIYPKLLQSQFFRDLAQPRKGGSKATESSFGTDLTTTYYVPRYSHATRVLDDDRRYAAQGPFEIDMIGAKLAAGTVDLKREVKFATDYFAASKGWTDKIVGTDFTAWDDPASSNPQLDVDNFRDEMEGKIGSEPNLMVIGKVAYTKGLKWNPALMDVIRFTQRGVLTQAEIESILGFRILVGKAIYTTSVEGTAEASVSYTRIWGKHVLILNNPDTAVMTAPALARLSLSTVPGSERYMRRFRYDEEEYDKMEANSYFAYKQIDARAGTFMGSVVS